MKLILIVIRVGISATAILNRRTQYRKPLCANQQRAPWGRCKRSPTAKL